MRFCCSLERDARISELFFDGLVLEKKEFLNLLPHNNHKNPKEEEEEEEEEYIYAQTQ